MKVKIIANICLATFIAFTISACSDKKKIFIRFDDVGLLTVGDPVKYLGLKIGDISNMQILGKSVLVEIVFSSKIPISVCDTGVIDHIGMMGERQVRIWVYREFHGSRGNRHS